MKLVPGDRVRIRLDRITPSHVGREGTVLLVDKNKRRPIRVSLEFGDMRMDCDYQRHEVINLSRWFLPYNRVYNSKKSVRFLRPWRVPTVGTLVGTLAFLDVLLQH